MSILDKLNQEEQDVEEILLKTLSPSSVDTLGHIVQNTDLTKIPPISRDYALTAARILNPKIVLPESKDILYTSTFAEAIEDIVDFIYDSDQSLAENVRRGCIQVYSDFMSKTVLEKDEKLSVSEKISPLELSQRELYKGVRADVRVVVESLMPLFKDIEGSLNYVKSLNDIRHLAAANVVVQLYSSNELKNHVQDFMSSGKISPAGSFVYSILNYHKDFLSRIGEE